MATMSKPSEMKPIEGTQLTDGKDSYTLTAQVGSKDKSAGYYEEFSECPSDARELLESYAQIPPDKVDAHIIAIRDKAWDIFPYPCIGKFRFLNLVLYKQPSYESMLARLKSGEAKYLDIGFCMGQDIRKLVADGAPSQNLYGAEVEGPFIDLSYDLWCDRDTLQAHLIQASALDLNGGLGKWRGMMDYIQLANVLHVFDREKQALQLLTSSVEVLENCVQLLNPDKPNTMIMGRAVGDIAGIQAPGGSFLHSDVTLRQLCAEISERTGGHLDCRATLGTGFPWEDLGLDRARRLVFEIEVSGSSSGSADRAD